MLLTKTFSLEKSKVVPFFPQNVCCGDSSFKLCPVAFKLILVAFPCLCFPAEGVDVAASRPMLTVGTIAGLGLILLKSTIFSLVVCYLAILEGCIY